MPVGPTSAAFLRSAAPPGFTVCRNPLYSGQPRLLRRLLCKKYMSQLQARTTAPTPWLNSRINSSNVLYVLDSGESSELLHQCYAYMTYGTGGVRWGETGSVCSCHVRIAQ
jgi:hypothetical protein